MLNASDARCLSASVQQVNHEEAEEKTLPSSTATFRG